MDKLKGKLVKTVVKKKAEKFKQNFSQILSSNDESREKDVEPDSKTSNSSSKQKVRTKFRNLRMNRVGDYGIDGRNSDEETYQTETPVETSDGGETTEEVAADYSTPTSQKDPEEGTAIKHPEIYSKIKNPRKSKDLAKFQNTIFENQKASFKIGVHIFDASALQGLDGQELNPMVRVKLDQKQRKTRIIRGTDSPSWDQTIEFNMKTTPGELCEKTLIFKVYSSGSPVRVPLIGCFKYALSRIFKRPNHRAINQFVPLREGDEEDDVNGPIRGFLRVSVAITYPGYNGPMGLRGPGSGNIEMINAAELFQYKLKFRIYKLLSIVKQTRFSNMKTPESPVDFAVEICLNERKILSDFKSSEDENIAFNQELILPLMWPTVAKNIRVRILSKVPDGNPKKCKITVVCTTFLELKQLCQSGENGYLPVFGPGFINFFGPDFNLKLPKKAIEQVKNEGTGSTAFYGRLFCDLTCTDGKVSDSTSKDLTLSVIYNSGNYYIQKSYTLFSSFFAANSIDSEYKSENVQFAISIGEFGNPEYDYGLKCTERSLPAMPIYDYQRFYAMPWGSYKPVCEVHCSWEDISQRITQASCVLKITEFLKEFRDSASLQSDVNSTNFSTVSMVLYALEEATNALQWIVKNAAYLSDGSMKLTQLDKNLQSARFTKFQRLQLKMEKFKYEQMDPDEMNGNALNVLDDVVKELEELILDPQISIPDVLIMMLVNNVPVAYAKVPVVEIAFNPNEIKTGINCGKLKAFKLSWLNRKEKTVDEVPAILHARFWFGLSIHRNFFEKIIAPGKIRYYAEHFVNEYKGPLGKFQACEFRPIEKAKTIYSTLSCKSPYYVSDQTGVIELSETTMRPPTGWEFKGNWRRQQTHDMWIGPETGSSRFEDEVFELEKKEDDEWNSRGFTNNMGEDIPEGELNRPPSGWKYEGIWEVDLFGESGFDGWVYSVTENFSEKIGAVDVNERPAHKFRKRRLKRFRVFDDKKMDMYSMYEDKELFQKRCDASGWEYAKAFDKPLHMQKTHGDKFRRKRMLREIVRKETSANKLNVRIDQKQGSEEGLLFTSPRIYEVYEEICSFELRVYVLWAKELYCSTTVISRSFVRVFFLHRCAETAIIKHTMNPVYNETLIFRQMLIPGGICKLRENPPSAVVEVVGESFDGINVVLGRFYVAPTVMDLSTKALLNCKWYKLENSKQNVSGALLFYSELYQVDMDKRHRLPKYPSFKNGGIPRYEVPENYRPKFVPYTVVIICYGLRNLQRYQFASIRQPWLEVTVGDFTRRTIPLKDAKVNPNFESPILIFEEVQMPDNLYFAPPIQILLFDKRTFGIQPQIGICTISNFRNYQRSPQNKIKVNEEDWVKYDTIAQEEQIEEDRELVRFEETKGWDSDAFFVDPDDPNSPRIDWWSKYYFSCGEDTKAPGYERLSLGKLLIFKTALEDVGDYRGFGDFMDTFKIGRASRKKGRMGVSTEICGELKGKVFVMKEVPDKPKGFIEDIPGVEFDKTVQCIVRVYVIRALNVEPDSKKGPLDLQVSVTVGRKKKSTSYVPDSCNPIFGELIEIDANIPVESTLKITLQDKKRIFGTDDIGETTVNLEDRLQTKYRATVGLPLCYNLFGPLPWRDQMTPLDILARYCKKMNVSVPKILTKENDVGMVVFSLEIWLSQLETKVLNEKNRKFFGRPLQRLALFILHGIGLVPEHVETRPLFSVVNPDVKIGDLECFIDIIPVEIGPIPSPIDISIRKSSKYQLRVVVWKTRNVIPIKKSFGKSAIDLYVECNLNGNLTEKTDIHYRVTDGAGSFNWRFVFDFEYDLWEKKIRVKRKNRFLRKATIEKIDPVLVLRICDNNKFKKDGFVGECVLPLLGFEEGQMNEEEMTNVYYPEQHKKCKCCVDCCGFFWQTRCKSSKMEKVKLPRAPIYVGGTVGVCSLFSSKSVRGWWPCLNTNISDEQKTNVKSMKKKDDFDGKIRYVTGMIDLEMSLVTAEEAAKEPVGKKRGKPNRNPVLPKPDRLKFDNYWYLSRCRAGSRFYWRKCGLQCLCISCCSILLVFLIGAFIWQIPEFITKVVGDIYVN